MITNIPNAHHYFLQSLLDIGDPIFVGDKLTLNEVALHMNDDQVIGMQGVAGMRCIIMVSMDKKEIEERIALAKSNLLGESSGEKK